MSICPPTALFVIQRVNILDAVSNVGVTALDLKAIIKRHKSKKDDQALLLSIMMAINAEYFGPKGMTIVLDKLRSQVFVGVMDHGKMLTR